MSLYVSRQGRLDIEQRKTGICITCRAILGVLIQPTSTTFLSHQARLGLTLRPPQNSQIVYKENS
jgi:hypothetical protein